MDKYDQARRYLENGKPAKVVASLCGMTVAEVEGLVPRVPGGAVTVMGEVTPERVREMAAAMAPDMLRALYDIAMDEGKATAARTTAATSIINYGGIKSALDVPLGDGRIKGIRIEIIE